MVMALITIQEVEWDSSATRVGRGHLSMAQAGRRNMKRVAMSSIVLLAVLAPNGEAQTTHTGAHIGTVQSPEPNRDCFFFTLVGVTKAEPQVNPTQLNDPWFAVPRTHLGFREILAIVLTASSLVRSVEVLTTGSAACGEAGVNRVLLLP